MNIPTPTGCPRARLCCCCGSFRALPERREVGGPGQTEARLLRRSAPAVHRCAESLLDKIEQVVQLIRSKGVGVLRPQNRQRRSYWASSAIVNVRTRSPRAIEGGQAAAETMRANPKIDTEKRSPGSRRRPSCRSRRKVCLPSTRLRTAPRPHRSWQRMNGARDRRVRLGGAYDAHRPRSACERLRSRAASSPPAGEGALAPQELTDSIKGSLGGSPFREGRRSPLRPSPERRAYGWSDDRAEIIRGAGITARWPQALKPPEPPGARRAGRALQESTRRSSILVHSYRARRKRQFRGTTIARKEGIDIPQFLCRVDAFSAATTYH